MTAYLRRQADRSHSDARELGIIVALVLLLVFGPIAVVSAIAATQVAAKPEPTRTIGR